MASRHVGGTLKQEATELLADDWQQLANRWGRHLRIEKGEQTQKLYRHAVAVKFLPWLGATYSGDLGGVSREHLNRWLLALEDQGLAPGSRSVYRAAVGAFFGWMAAEEEITANPFAGGKVAKVKVPETTTPLLSAEDLARLLKAAAKDRGLGPRNAMLIAFMFESGLRVSEVAALDVQDLNLNHGSAVVRHGKGDRFRTASFGNECARQFDRYLSWRRKYLARLKWGRETDALFISRDGGRLGSSGIRRLMDLLGEAVGLPGLHPHSFRHASASHAALNGADEMTLRRNYGWSSKSQMPSHYTQLIQTERAMQMMKAASPLDRMRR